MAEQYLYIQISSNEDFFSRKLIDFLNLKNSDFTVLPESITYGHINCPIKFSLVYKKPPIVNLGILNIEYNLEEMIVNFKQPKFGIRSSDVIKYYLLYSFISLVINNFNDYIRNFNLVFE